MKKYDEYKDSGVAWIGEVPKHWEVIKTSLAFQGIGSGTTPSTSKKEYYDDNGNGNYWLQTGDLEDGIVYDTSKKVSNIAIKECNLTFYPIDSIIIAMYGATIGKVGILGIESATNQACCVIPVTKKQIAKYFFYEFLACKPALLIAAIGGGQPNISQDTIKKLKIVIPPINEQTAIAAYLDTHCAKIDNLISIQQKRIALLQELKQSVITHVITKGLNPNVEMKQSGVEWIGDVPKHWEVMPLKKYCKMNKGLTFTKADIVDEGESVISYGQIHSKLNNGVSLDCKLIRHVPIGIVKNGEKSKAHKGDFIFADTSEDYEGCGNFVYNDTNQAIYGGYHTIILQTETLNAKYIGYLFKTDCWRYQIRSRVYGVKVYSITQSILSICSIILPPQDEQKQIASYLYHKCATIDTSISNAQHQIDLLQEYKQSLITEVVTGKRKVTDN